MTTNELLILPVDRQEALLGACRDERRKARARYETQMILQLLAQWHYTTEWGQSHVHEPSTT